jgi:UDP-N-acetylglucosamine diphosphorylase/glucosamine-1-phosphate N-acetyltransferase
MPSVIIYDDGAVDLRPLTDLRAAFDIRTGALTTRERLTVLLEQVAECPVAALIAPADIALLVAERSRYPVNPDDLRAVCTAASGDDTVFVINGRAVLPPANLGELEVGQGFVEDDGSLIGAHLSLEDALAFLADFKSLPADLETAAAPDRVLMRYPWDVIAMRDHALLIDLAMMLSGESQELPEGVVAIEGDEEPSIRIAPTAVIYPTVVLDASEGPIVIDDGVTIRPQAIIRGPAYIGIQSTILDRALIKPHTAIGPICKVAGEVGGTIFQGFANKAHEGHLGDSWIGEWANLGADTTNSNLLNTYDPVVMQTVPAAEGGRKQRTGLQFLGCLMGDHTKTAINSTLMTGSCFSTGTMIATTAAPPAFTDRFSWCTDAGIRSFRMNKFIEIVRTVMGRRGIEPSEDYIARLHTLAQNTGGDEP